MYTLINLLTAIFLINLICFSKMSDVDLYGFMAEYAKSSNLGNVCY